MGEQLPLETLKRFVMTALPKIDGERRYFSRPEKVTESYEARRFLAYRQPPGPGDPVHGQVEFFEYHWSYKMTDNRLRDLLPTFRRLMLRGPRTVPYGLLVVWVIAWLVLLALAALLLWLLVRGSVDGFTLEAILLAVGSPVLVAAVVVWLLKFVSSVVTSSFVDVVRYLDTSPRSYAVRRDIREGMVDLLRGIHDRGRYTRLVVVAHSLGSYIAYDGLTALWHEMNDLHGGPLRDSGPPPHLEGLSALQKAARALADHPADITDLTPEQWAELHQYRARQFALWKSCRKQGNPWLVTDFISLGSPMYFADLLLTKNRRDFDRLVKNSELPQCPPRSGSQMVEGDDKSVGRAYAYDNRGRQVLRSGMLFAVVRWTNLYFPPERHWFGDWFGGRLRPLFGTGILDEALLGNLPGRRRPGLAHGRYFSYPDDHSEASVTTRLQRHLDLNIDAELADVVDVPEPLAATRSGAGATT
ncbi:hypothetical protein [Ornithinimicrobium sufpigmenti]|uniref:hypothetical protein n=1 Tax=Ornithinimicrobium sufpigmenti TaxID=2508882 RepID=UPI001035DCB3|nr:MULTISPECIES: hypothetical protein [unclassified Ornithinimicrobium]